MKFTLNNTLHEIMSKTGPGLSMFFHESMLQFIPDGGVDVPLSELKDNLIMPWGAPFPADDVVRDANCLQSADEYWDYLPLWTEKDFRPGTGSPENVCLVKLKTPAIEGVRPCVIICPGGAYQNLAFNSEGLQIASRFAEAQIRPFILNYRFSPNHYPVPQTDLALAIKYLRAHADQFEIDPDNLMIIGFSAGGHLCASTTALRDEVNHALQQELERTRPDLAASYESISMRPDKVTLCYPVISFSKEQHEESFEALTGGDESLRGKLSIELQVDPDYPKTFIWTNADDSLVPPSNTTRMGQALTDRGIPHKMVVFPQGEHGCGLGAGTSAEGWFDEMLGFMYGTEEA